MAEKLLMIALSPTMEKGTIVKWVKKENESFTEGDVLCEVETDKTTMEYEATEEGTLLKILVPEGEKAAVGEPIAIFGEPGEDISDLLNENIEKVKSEEIKSETIEKETVKEIENIKAKEAEFESISDSIKISPLAKKIALMKNIDITRIKGTGLGGRIIKRDVENYKLLAEAYETPAISLNNDEDRTIPLSDKRRIIGERLSQSKYTSPHFYLTVSVNMENIMENRKMINNRLNEKISMNAFLIKIIANTLRKHRRINSTLQNNKIIEFSRIDIALAVAQEDGLITPIVRNADKKGILQIESELRELIEKAKNNKLEPEEYTNATFTISNLGSFGVDEFTAIINPPASAILAVGMIKKIPIVENDEIIIKPMMKMTLSSDHRVIDGSVAAIFMKDLKETLENPILAIL
ncbi:pyruvate dehydrogenase E2 component (dihydrolipoamide acetyltransferase) [Marinitoga hydrogenitolerans DSM 16785]|uniref:Dihydrolipoamide acetyltransferase component of pyruvate dehydrogenase complex n=1 Tax=Marinitoga hydrogenitolerans (strain DSM 16785 / JCM 12826 / AT1271) TaxID=1122195 RepID=A0A1M4WRI9_MARH1|nr:dihydrolipoamide acetyltransferase family protein [Marinitoga hydrogenitolerans]SHE83846.1 pyruvate dehydrogenase E2 component (dihydrolipoamide acetyltransferase) [Marinitoga hydrogenitolerans DSM 16785]